MFPPEFEKHIIYEPNCGCWLWGGQLARGVYGRLQYNRETQYAHRVAWEIANKKSPKGFNVCHHCDMPSCVNPDHLFLGTQADNMQDASRKNRLTNRERGSMRANALLDENKVREIRNLIKDGHKYRDIAPRFGVNPRTIYGVLCGTSWRHVK